MRTKILTWGLVFIFLSAFISAQLSESDVVYVIPGEKIYHLANCEKLGNRKTGMALSIAKKKGYTACPVCFPEKKETLQKIEKKLEIPLKIDTKIETPAISKSGFRETLWGMSQEQVKKIEKSEFMKKEHSKSSGLDILIYKEKAGELDCILGYYFAENQLVEGRYVFIEKHFNKNLFIHDFKKVKEQLIEKYGMPKEDETIWRNDLYKDDPSHWGTAVSIGHLVFETTWKLPETKITLQCYGDNFEVNHRLSYISEINKHKELVKKAKEKAKKVIW